eukprot:TRINITY_DN5823_c0_g1_i4.p1 TRINITY_DN5823_c0_g1~~TRINITY_DN5823_c0_g1_i4.p1  ORF type:complete len:482 (-),score=85.85 TRINITY_DN5823_c0_g1_i4:63-1508(-)
MKVARYELNRGTEFAKEYQIKRFPYIVVFKNSEPYYYNDIFDYSRIMRFLNRIDKPIINLKNAESLDHFLNRPEQDYEGNKINTVKIFGLFYDPEETEEDLKDFRIAAEFLAQYRQEVYFGLMQSQKEIKKVKEKYGDQFFPDNYTLTVIVVQNYPGKYQIIDISELKRNRISDLIIFKGLRLAEEFTIQTWELYKAKKKPILVLLIDTISNWEASKKLLRTTEEIAKQYFEQIQICWVEGQLNPAKKQMLGITHDNIPAMGFFRIDYQTKIAWPSEWPLDGLTIREFIDDYINMPIEYLIEKYERDVKKLKKSRIYAYLQNTIELNDKDFKKQLDSKPDKDILILFFNSRKHIEQKSMAVNYNHISKRFKDFYINSVQVCIFDTFYNEFPAIYYEESPDDPFLILYPAHQSHDTYIKFETEFKSEQLMRFVEENSDGRIALPELPHVPEELLDEYLSMSAQASEETPFDEDRFLLIRDEL